MANLLRKTINAAGKSKRLIWYQENGYHYINDGVVTIKTSALTDKELGCLVEHLKIIPEPGECAHQQINPVLSSGADSFIKDSPKLFDSDGDYTGLAPTNLIQATPTLDVEIFTKGQEYVYLDINYQDLWACCEGMSYNKLNHKIYILKHDEYEKEKDRTIEVIIKALNAGDIEPSTHLANLSQITISVD